MMPAARKLAKEQTLQFEKFVSNICSQFHGIRGAKRRLRKKKRLE